MKSVNTKGLMLGMLAIGGLIAGGALMAGQAYAQTITPSSTIGQANVNTDNDAQEASAEACPAVAAILGFNVCGNTEEEEGMVL
jgi:hypothetical protein